VELRDQKGAPTIQNLLAVAKQGGGLVRYNWVKPSTHKPAPKLGYVVAMPNWGWMMGTGLYLDDVDAALAKVDAQQSGNIQTTMWWIAGLAILSALAVASSGLALNISECAWPTPSSRCWPSGWSNRRRGAGAAVARPARRHQPVAGVDQAADRGRDDPPGRQARSSSRRAPASSAPPRNSTTCWAKCGASRTTCVRPSWTTWAWPPRSITWPGIHQHSGMPVRFEASGSTDGCRRWWPRCCSASPRKR
jgi:hypothetical protein